MEEGKCRIIAKLIPVLVNKLSYCAQELAEVGVYLNTLARATKKPLPEYSPLEEH